MSFERITEALFDWQKKREVLAVEIFAFIKDGLKIQKKDQNLEAFEPFREEGGAIRVFHRGSCGFSYTTHLTPEEIHGAAERALETAQVMEKDEAFGFPEKEEYPLLELPTPQELSVEEKFEILERVEKAALSFDPRIKRLQEVSLKQSTTTIWVANSLGTRALVTIPGFSLVTVVVAEEEGQAQMGWEWQAALSPTQVDPRAIGQEAAKRAISRLKAEMIPSRKISILLPPHIAVDFLDLVSEALSGDQVVKGKSFLAGKLGEKVFSELITIVDDGLLPEGLESRSFDDEGHPQETKTLIHQGVLERFLFDTYWGRKAGASSTGNARRGSFKSPPGVGLTNFFIKPGNYSREDLLCQASPVFEVLEVLGMHTADPVSGDFSVGVSGLLHQGGSVRPITGMALSGNIFELFKRVEALGNDLRFYGSMGSPSILIGKMDLSGA